MKKFLCALTVLLCICCFAGCSSGWVSTVKDYEGAVSSNGGFAVQKGDYLYYINGVAEQTAENKFGTPVKGALVRTKVADLGKDNAEAEIVVPKVMFTSDRTQNSGIYIFGDYVYYTTPCDIKNKQGVVQTGMLEYRKIKLDGTDSQIIVTLDGVADPYRFVEIDEKVYLTIYATDASDSLNYLTVYDTESCEVVKKSEAITGYIFSTDATSPYAFYEKKTHNEDLDEDEAFSEIHCFKLDGSSDIVVIAGAPDKVQLPQGATYSLVSDNGKELYFSQTDLSASGAVHYAVSLSDLTIEDTDEARSSNYSKITMLSANSSEVAIASTSLFISKKCIVYFDSTYGIMKYDYEKINESYRGKVQLCYNRDVAGFAFRYYDSASGYAYFTDTENCYYRISLSSLINLETGETKGDSVEVERLTYFAVNTSFFFPEVFGNYILAPISGASTYMDYIYALDIKVADGKDEEWIAGYIEQLAEETEENILERNKRRLGILSSADKDSYDNYMEETFPDEDSSSTSVSA